MKVDREAALAILEGLGLNKNPNLPDVVLVRKLSQLHARIADDQAIGDPELDNVLDDIIAAGADGEKFEITSTAKQGKAVTTTVRRRTSKQAPAYQEDDDEVEEEEDLYEDEDEGPDEEEEDEEEYDEDLDEDEEEEEEEEDEEEDEAEEEEPPKVKPARKAPLAKRVAGRKRGGPWKPRDKRGRPFYAGMVLRKHGLSPGVLPEMIKEVDLLVGKQNPKESERWLKMAWHIVAGYDAEEE